MTSSGPGPFPPVSDAPLPPAHVQPEGVRVHRGVPYAATPGHRPLELDLYLPPADAVAPFPLVVFAHGGGWRLGSRHSAGPAYSGWQPTPFERVAQAGVAVASADYRLSGEATWPAPLHDLKAAVRWLRVRAAGFGGDPDRIAAWGESAGGHLAALLGLTGDDPDLEGEVGVQGPSSHVTAVVAWYPPTDLLALPDDLGADPASAESREALLLGAPVSAAPDLAAQASPLRHVSSAAPPFLLLHGDADHLVPAVQSERLHAALRAENVPSELVLYLGADHMWRGSDAAATDALTRTITALTR